MDASSSRLEVCKELLIQNAAILSIDRKKYMISRNFSSEEKNSKKQEITAGMFY